jgi:hypothetical protein
MTRPRLNRIRSMQPVLLASAIAASGLCRRVCADPVQQVLGKLRDAPSAVRVSVGPASASLESRQTAYELTALTSRLEHASPLGMARPSTANFYYGGFMRVNYYGHTTGTQTPRLDAGKDSHDNECVVATWALDAGPLQVSFTLLPECEVLMTRISGPATQRDGKRFHVRLLLYPQSFNAAKRGQPRENFCLTSDHVVARVPDSLACRARWVYLGDARFEGKTGGAAVGIVPEQVNEMRVHLSGYSTMVDLFFRDVECAYLLLGDFGCRELPLPEFQAPAIVDREYKRFREWADGGR